MKKIILFLGINLLVVSSQLLFGQITLKRGIVKIIHGDDIGTGIVFHRAGNNTLYILTANHVVRGSRTNSNPVIINFSEDPLDYTAEIYYSYGDYDLAILSLSVFPGDIPILYMGQNNPDNNEIEVTMHGYPAGEYTSDKGIISKYYMDKIVLDNINPEFGNSGGPIIENQYNSVIGIVLEKAAQTDQFQYAFNINFVKNLLQNTEIVNNAIIDAGDDLANGGSNISEMFYLSF